jgi:hypothetical protein
MLLPYPLLEYPYSPLSPIPLFLLSLELGNLGLEGLILSRESIVPLPRVVQSILHRLYLLVFLLDPPILLHYRRIELIQTSLDLLQLLDRLAVVVAAGFGLLIVGPDSLKDPLLDLFFLTTHILVVGVLLLLSLLLLFGIICLGQLSLL